jgi:hypothetical protein
MRIAFFIATVLGLTSSVQADFVLVDSKAGITLRPHDQPKTYDDTDGEVKMSCVPFSLAVPSPWTSESANVEPVVRNHLQLHANA